MVSLPSVGRCGAAVLALVAGELATTSAVALDLVDLVKKVEHSVVRVDTDTGFGSGVIVDDRGYVFTNFHVIDGATKVTITLRSGELMQAKGFLAVDPSRDLALVKTDKLDGAHAVRIAAGAPQVGEKVAAFGNPRGFSFTTSEGIISGVRTGKDVSATIGADNYRALGFGANATWVQTTAPISPGNSGGPLVNMNAEVVGLNTWHYAAGQNLNFAISAADMNRLLGAADAANLSGFVALPKRAMPLDPPTGRNRPSGFNVELPTGRVFSLAIFETELTTVRLNANNTEGVVVIKHPNGAMYAAASQQKGVLNGVTLAQYENRQPMVYAQYADGKRHGNLKTWDEAGRPVLFAQYLKGRRNGFSCMFADGELAMLVQYKYDKPEWIQLMADRKVLEGFSSQEEAEKHPEARELLARLEELEARIKKNEVAFRKQVSAHEQERRKALARKLGPEKRRRIQQRSAARAAASAAFLREMYRRAYGR